MSSRSAPSAWPVAESSAWIPYLEKKVAKRPVEGLDLQSLADRCVIRSTMVVCGHGHLRAPRKNIVAKAGGKTREVFTFNDKRDPIDGLVVGFFAKSLSAYDGLFAPNLYSYRYETSMKNAIVRLRNVKGLERMYAYKVDVSNYFNSIDVDRLFDELQGDIDESSFAMLSGIVNNPDVMFKGKHICEYEKGVMAGTPTSAFLANYYLKDLDWYFHRSGAIYCRYADDIIVFADTKEELDQHVEYIREFIFSKGLSINPSKEEMFSPGDRIMFLGMDFVDGKAELSRSAKDRVKARVRGIIKRHRRQVEKGRMSSVEAMKSAIGEINHYLFLRERSWSSWYFPLISSTKGLEELDDYVQQSIRYVCTGKHTKRNVRSIPYDRLSEYGYLPLKSRYYGGGKAA